MDMSTAAMQKISVVDHINGFQYTPERSTEEDNFVIDMEDLSHNRESYPSSRITLQRSLSRKGLIRGGMEKKAVESVAAAEAVSSPRGASLLGSSSTPEKGNATMDHHHHQQGNHQIAITSVAGSIKATSTVDQGRCTTRRNSFKRCQAHWLLDPRKVVIFFAALSSMGTLLLIFFTLSIGRLQSDEAAAAAASAALE